MPRARNSGKRLLKRRRGEVRADFIGDVPETMKEGTICPKLKSKAQMMWEVSKEAEENFFSEAHQSLDTEGLVELLKLIRGAEYRRGKEDGRRLSEESSTGGTE